MAEDIISLPSEVADITSPDDFKFESNHFCEASNIFYQRAVANGFSVRDLQMLRNAYDRVEFVKILREHGQNLCKLIDLDHFETDGVHDVTHGDTPFGDFFFCDILSELYDVKKGDNILDFGCSTGRVIRNFKSAYPDVNAFGCDPRISSIEFMKERVPRVTWIVNDDAPPIFFPEEIKFNMVFAISVWSHFSEKYALKWFDEMARLIVPGGKLIFSTHGLRSVYHFWKVKNKMPEAKAIERIEALKNGRFHYAAYGKSEFDSHWGMAYIPTHWIEKNLDKNWQVETFAPGLAMANQDVYALTRK